MKYVIMTKDQGRWGEGWSYGDVVEIDLLAARVALENGEIKPYKDEPVKSGELVCSECGKVCKNKLGLNSHLRTHK